MQVNSIQAAAQLPTMPKQAPVLSFESFCQLCNAPPLQVSHVAYRDV